MHFEIHALKPEETGKFYAEIFGWKITKWEGPMEYWLVSTKVNDAGIDGAILRRIGPAPEEGAAVNAYVCTIAVDSLDNALEKVKARGGSIALEKNEVPGVGWLAYAKDPEGNIFGIIQPN